MPCLPGHPLRSLRCRVPFALRKGRYRLNRSLRRFSQMGYDAPRPFVPGFWVPAPVSGYGAGPAGTTVGFNRRALFFSGFPPARE